MSDLHEVNVPTGSLGHPPLIMKDLHLFALFVHPDNKELMAWTLLWPFRQRRRDDARKAAANWLTIDLASETEVRRIDLSPKDVWNLRNGSVILRDGLLVVPECGKLRFLQADSDGTVERKLVAELDSSVLA